MALHSAGSRLLAMACAAGAAAAPALAEKRYSRGASDSEISVGNIMPHSAPAPTYSNIGRAEATYFKKIDDKSGIYGRKVTVFSCDDGFGPPKAIEQVCKLVENDEVLLVFESPWTKTAALAVFSNDTAEITTFTDGNANGAVLDRDLAQRQCPATTFGSRATPVIGSSHADHLRDAVARLEAARDLNALSAQGMLCLRRSQDV